MRALNYYISKYGYEEAADLIFEKLRNEKDSMMKIYFQNCLKILPVLKNTKLK